MLCPSPFSSNIFVFNTSPLRANVPPSYNLLHLPVVTMLCLISAHVHVVREIIHFFLAYKITLIFFSYGSMELDLWHYANLAQICLRILDKQLIQPNSLFPLDFLFALKLKDVFFCYIESILKRGKNSNLHIIFPNLSSRYV